MKKVFQKRLLSSLVLSLLLIYFFSIVFVFAQEVIPTPRPEGGQTNFDMLRERVGGADFTKFFSDVDFTGKLSSLLLGLLLWMILFSIFKQMQLFEHSSVYWSGGVALIVTILSFLYIPSDLIKAISAEYAALGATIITVIPFAIAIYFSVWITQSLIIGRLIWVAFFIYYIVIFAQVWGFNTYQSFNFWDPVNLPYEIALLVSLLFFIFLAPIREKVWKEHVRSVGEKINKNIDEFGLGIQAGKRVARTAAGRYTWRNP